jgi:hypothetical protein
MTTLIFLLSIYFVCNVFLAGMTYADMTPENPPYFDIIYTKSEIFVHLIIVLFFGGILFIAQKVTR